MLYCSICCVVRDIARNRWSNIQISADFKGPLCQRKHALLEKKSRNVGEKAPNIGAAQLKKARKRGEEGGEGRRRTCSKFASIFFSLPPPPPPEFPLQSSSSPPCLFPHFQPSLLPPLHSMGKGIRTDRQRAGKEEKGKRQDLSGCQGKGGKEEKLQGPFFQPSRVPPPYSFPLPVLHSRGGLRTGEKQRGVRVSTRGRKLVASTFCNYGCNFL